MREATSWNSYGRMAWLADAAEYSDANRAEAQSVPWEIESWMLCLHQHVFAFNFDRIHRHLRRWIVCYFSRLGVVLPAVPRAYHFALFDYALSQWPAAVQAHVVHGAQRAFAIGDADGLITHHELSRLAVSRDFGL